MSNWERLVWNQRDALLSGLGVTLEICFLAFAGAIVGGLILCLIRLYVAPLRPLAVLLIEFFRATPIFVQLMWVNYVWPEILGWPNTFFTAGWVALALQSSGYLAETFRTGIEAVPRAHREAALAVGMSHVQVFRRIVLPQALLTAAPSLVNQFPVVVNSSTLVSVIAGSDVPEPEDRERLVRADRSAHGDGGDLYRPDLLHLASRQVCLGLASQDLRTAGLIILPSHPTPPLQHWSA